MTSLQWLYIEGMSLKALNKKNKRHSLKLSAKLVMNQRQVGFYCADLLEAVAIKEYKLMMKRSA